jgi:endonuclease/exonuclease/phosphatase family metal-dependent hydrolase
MKFTCMTFNVLAPIWLDSYLKQKTTKRTISAAYRYSRIRAVLLEHKPDIVFLQEATTALLRRLPASYEAVISECQTVADINVFTVILFRKSIKRYFPNLQSSCVTLGEKYRASVLANDNVIFVNTHFVYDDVPTAKRQLKRLLRALPSQSKSDRRVVIIAGDFNMESRHFHADCTRPAGFRDLTRTSSQSKAKRTPKPFPKPTPKPTPNPTPKPTHPNRSEAEMSISKFLVRGRSCKASAYKVHTARTLTANMAQQGSDHYPCTVVLELSNKSLCLEK